MNTLSTETIREITKEMPEKIRDLYMGTSEVTVVDVCDALGEQLGFTSTQTNSLISLIGNILLGRISFNSFNEEVQKITGDIQKTNIVAKEIEEKLFIDIKNDLEERYSAFSKYREPEQTTPGAPEPTVESSPAEETPVVIPVASTPTPTPQPAPQTPPSVQPFINTQNVRAETTHTLDREALLRELESPEPFSVPFTPRKTSFEEKMNPVAPVPPAQTTSTPPATPKPAQHIGGDPYRENPVA